jgi:hypothetical protein
MMKLVLFLYTLHGIMSFGGKPKKKFNGTLVRRGTLVEKQAELKIVMC